MGTFQNSLSIAHWASFICYLNMRESVARRGSHRAVLQMKDGKCSMLDAQ